MQPELSLGRSIAVRLFPRYSPFLDRVNWMARWSQTAKDNVQCPKFASREEMYLHLSSTLLGGGQAPIDYFEFGVARGDSLRSWCALNSHPETRFFGFDSFEGLPENWTSSRPKGAFSTSGKTPDISDPRVRFIVGWFQHSLPEFLQSYQSINRLVIHNDSDLYSSTLYCLTAMNAFIPAGTLIIFDEFYDVLHEYRALSDYGNAYMRKFRIVAATRRFNQAAVVIL
jgi:O-methyltransferase